jgi:hypothetical protein
MIKFLIFSFFLFTLFAEDKPLNGIVLNDLPLIDRSDQPPHPAKKLKQELTNEKPSGMQQRLRSKVEVDRTAKERINKAKKDIIDLKRTTEKLKKKS